MKTKTLLASAAIVALLIVGIIIHQQNSDDHVVHVQMSEASPEVPVHITSQSISASESSAALVSAALLKGPAARAVGDTLAKNPTIKLLPEDIKRIEQIFAKNYIKFIEERNRMVTGRATGVDSYEIQIPSCPGAGLRSLNAFLDEIRQLKIDGSGELVIVAKKMFEDHTEQAGRNGVTYSIQFKDGSDNLVRYTREVAMIDPATGRVGGTGFTYGELDLRNVDPVLVTAIQNANKK